MVSAFVLTTFTGSLAAPAMAAPAVGSEAAVASTMGAVSQSSLSNLWFVWGEHLKTLKGNTPSTGQAAQFFQAKGASPAQIDVLVNNARAQGHLTSATPTASQAAKGWMDKVKGLFKKKGAQTVAEAEVAAAKAAGDAKAASARPAGEAAAASSGGLVGKVKSFFARFKGGSTNAAASSQKYPVPQNFLKGGTATASAEVAAASAKAAPSAGAVRGAPASAGDGGLLSGIVQKVRGATAKVSAGVRNVADKVGLGARRGAHAVGSTVKTGYLTAKYKVDPRSYYKIPINGDTTLNVRSTVKSNVYFKEGKWVTQDFSYKSSWPTKADLATRVDTMGAGQPQAQGFFGKIVGKFKGLVDKTKTALRGEKNISQGTRHEIQRLEMVNQSIDQARAISDAQRALKVRIDQMKYTAESLRKPLDVKQVQSMEKAYKQLEAQRKDLLNRANGAMDSPAKTIAGDAMKWAAYSVGITAAVNLIGQAVSGDGIDIGEAFAFLGKPSFWAGTAGGFLGATVAGAVANAIIPGGGLFLKVLPGFLGAAFGFEFGSSLFGGQMDLLGTLVTTLASAGGYSLAAMMLGGVTAAPGIALVGAAIAAGSLAGFLLDKFRGDPDAEGYILPETPLGDAAELEAPSVTVETPQPAASMSPKASANLASAQAQVEQAYNAYITFLKARKIPEATTAHQAYMDAQRALELAKANAAAGK